MKVVILLTRRNVGIYSLSLLAALGYKVKVITDDENVKWLANVLNCELVDFETMGEYDLLLSIHWHKFIDKKYFEYGSAINIHPCLFKYPGHNPVKQYIKNGDTQASVESHWMTEKIDEGEVIHQEFFETKKCHNYADFYNQCVDKYFKCIDRTLKQVM